MNKNGERIRRIIWFVLENGPAVLTIIFAGYVTLLSQFRPLDVLDVAVWVLVVVALLATSELVERLRRVHRIQEVCEKTYTLVEHHIGDRTSATKFFHAGIPPLNEHFMHANTIDICGVTLSRTVREYFSIFEKRLRAGCSLRFLVIDPESQAAQQAAARSYAAKDPQLYVERVNTSLEFLRLLANLPDVKGEVEIRLLPFAPSLGLVIVDGDQPFGSVFVEIYQHMSIDPCPSFVLEPSRDGRWYEFFKDQFRRMWDASRPLPKESKPTME